VDRLALLREARYPAYRGLHDEPRWQTLMHQLEITSEQLAAIEFEVTLPPGVTVKKE